jgi:hypothetical protein
MASDTTIAERPIPPKGRLSFLILATLLSRARFELSDGEVPVPLARITLRPKNGLTLKVTPL